MLINSVLSWNQLSGETHPRGEEEIEVFVQQRLVLRIISAEVLKERVG